MKLPEEKQTGNVSGYSNWQQFLLRPKEHRKKVVSSLARFYAILKIYKSKAIQFKEVIWAKLVLLKIRYTSDQWTYEKYSILQFKIKWHIISIYWDTATNNKECGCWQECQEWWTFIHFGGGVN